MKKVCLNCGEWFDSKGKLCDRCSKLGTIVRGTQGASKGYFNMHKGDRFFKYLFGIVIFVIISAVIYGIGVGLLS